MLVAALAKLSAEPVLMQSVQVLIGAGCQVAYYTAELQCSMPFIAPLLALWVNLMLVCAWRQAVSHSALHQYFERWSVCMYFNVSLFDFIVYILMYLHGVKHANGLESAT